MTIQTPVTVQTDFDAVVFSRGRVTLPAEFRKLIGASAGTKLLFSHDGKMTSVSIKQPVSKKRKQSKMS